MLVFRLFVLFILLAGVMSDTEKSEPIPDSPLEDDAEISDLSERDVNAQKADLENSFPDNDVNSGGKRDKRFFFPFYFGFRPYYGGGYYPYGGWSGWGGYYGGGWGGWSRRGWGNGGWNGGWNGWGGWGR